jgi:hypothetical protein
MDCIYHNICKCFSEPVEAERKRARSEYYAQRNITTLNATVRALVLDFELVKDDLDRYPDSIDQRPDTNNAY